MRRTALVTLVTLLMACCQGDDGICDPERLRRALASATPGDTIRIGRCALPGDFEVPAGVTLEGVGRAESAIEALPGNDVATRLLAAQGVATRLRGLRVRGGIRAIGSGAVALEGLEVRPASGVAVDLGEANASLRDLGLVGAITAENADDERWVGAGAGDAPWVGVDARGGRVEAERVVVEGFARFGWVQVGGLLEARDLRITDSLSYGLLLEEAEADVAGLVIERTYQGLRGEPAIAFASRASALRLEGMQLSESDRYGLVAARGSAAISGLLSERSGDAALWVSGLEDLTVEESEIREARFAGLVAFDCARVEGTDLTIRDIESVRRNVGTGSLFGDLEIGDALHLMGALDDAVFRRVLLQRAERAAMVVQLGATPPRFEDVRVEAAAGLGAVAGRAVEDLAIDVMGEAGWDEGIERDAAAALADAAFRGRLDAARTSVPAQLPDF